MIACGAGGSLETVEEGLAEMLFRERSSDSAIAAIEAPPAMIAERARRFS